MDDAPECPRHTAEAKEGNGIAVELADDEEQQLVWKPAQSAGAAVVDLRCEKGIHGPLQTAQNRQPRLPLFMRHRHGDGRRDIPNGSESVVRFAAERLEMLVIATMLQMYYLPDDEGKEGYADPRPEPAENNQRQQMGASHGWNGRQRARRELSYRPRAAGTLYELKNGGIMDPAPLFGSVQQINTTREGYDASR